MYKKYNYAEAAEILEFPGGRNLMAKFLYNQGWIDSDRYGNPDLIDLGYIETETNHRSPSGNYLVHFRTYITPDGIEALRPLVEAYKLSIAGSKTKKNKSLDWSTTVQFDFLKQ
jgi:hypothetical protein